MDLSLENLIIQLEVQPPEKFQRTDRITSSGIHKVTLAETFYTWEGYKTNLDIFKVFLEKGSASTHRPSYKGVNKQLGFRIKVLDKGKVIQNLKENTRENKIKSLYEIIDTKVKAYKVIKKEEDFKLFQEIEQELLSQIPNSWEGKGGSKIYKNARETGCFYSIGNILTQSKKFKVIITQEITQIADNIGELILLPHPFTPEICSYKMRIFEKGKLYKTFSGKEYDSRINSIMVNLLKKKSQIN